MLLGASLSKFFIIIFRMRMLWDVMKPWLIPFIEWLHYFDDAYSFISDTSNVMTMTIGYCWRLI